LLLDAKQEAVLISLACEKPANGQVRWSLRQLGEKLVALEVVETISHETIRRTLKKTNLSPGKSGRGACRR
jgi:Homeodomain-like domain